LSLVFVMCLRGLVLLAWFSAGAARRGLRVDDSRYEARERVIPRVVGHLARNAPSAGALRLFGPRRAAGAPHATDVVAANELVLPVMQVRDALGPGKSRRKPRSRAELQTRQKQTEAALADAKADAKTLLDAKASTEKEAEEKTAAVIAANVGVKKAKEALARAEAAEKAALAAKKTADAAVTQAINDAASSEKVIAEAQQAADEAAEAVQQWQKDNAITEFGASLGSAVGAAATDGLLYAIFGEKKSVRLEREKREAAKRKKQMAAELKAEAEQRARDDAVAERVRVAAEKAAAAARVAEVAAAEAALVAEEAREVDERRAVEEAERKAAETARLDEEVRRKREEAEAALKQREAQRFTQEFAQDAVDTLFDAALPAATKDSDGDGSGGGSVAAWAIKQKEKLEASAAAKEKVSRLQLFEADLELLGLSVDAALEMDEKGLRKAWRKRMQLLHPDVRDQRSEEELEGIPSVYEINNAFEAVKKLLFPARVGDDVRGPTTNQ